MLSHKFPSKDKLKRFLKPIVKSIAETRGTDIISDYIVQWIKFPITDNVTIQNDYVVIRKPDSTCLALYERDDGQINVLSITDKDLIGGIIHDTCLVKDIIGEI